MRATEAVADVLSEKRADAPGAKICHAVLAIPRQDNGIREDYLMLVDAALEVAQNIIAAGHMVAKVAEGLHDFPPYPSLVGPSAIAVELLVVLDKWLA